MPVKKRSRIKDLRQAQQIAVLQSTGGVAGPAGSTGPDGPQGPAGPGVPAGGTTSQVLSKINATDYNTQWTTPSAGGGSPLQGWFI